MAATTTCDQAIPRGAVMIDPGLPGRVVSLLGPTIGRKRGGPPGGGFMLEAGTEWEGLARGASPSCRISRGAVQPTNKPGKKGRPWNPQTHS
jgi:hypothetical protein